MPDRDTPNALHGIGGASRRPARKRASPCPAPQLDPALLDILAQSEVPLSAYDLVSRLRDRGRHVVVMSIYRALDRLRTQQRIEKVEMLSAFRIRDSPQAILMICVACGRTRALSVPVQHDALDQAMANAGFAASGIAIEAAGLCRDCSKPEESSPTG